LLHDLKGGEKLPLPVLHLSNPFQWHKTRIMICHSDLIARNTESQRHASLHDKRHMTWDVKICRILVIDQAGVRINRVVK
jgi:hypothetical protein